MQNSRTRSGRFLVNCSSDTWMDRLPCIGTLAANESRSSDGQTRYICDEYRLIVLTHRYCLHVASSKECRCFNSVVFLSQYFGL